MRLKGVVLVLVLLLIAGTGSVFAFNVGVTAPVLVAKHQAVDAIIADINLELSGLAGDFERQLRGETAGDDIARFSNPKLLARGFANAGATASHLGTQRTFIDYRRFAFVIGTGFGIVVPDLGDMEGVAEEIEEKGDVYIGMAVQPVSASLGINLSRFVDGLRANVKIGYFSISEGTVADDVSFESLSLAVGASYQLVGPRSLPLGVIRWRGLSVASGFNFQRNTSEVNISLDPIRSEPLMFSDVGLDPSDVDQTGDPEFGNLVLAPELKASIESRTYAIPLEVNTGIRFLYLLELNAGAGVDIVMGSSELTLGAVTDVDFETSAAASGLVEVAETGEGVISTKTTNSPQLARPRITAGVGLNLGPVKLDVPLMYYFDTDGPGVMAGVNVGIVW